MKNLNAKARFGLFFLAAAMALLLFGGAGTTRYWQAWGYLAVFLGASSLFTVYLMKHDPAPLKRRLRGRPLAEKERRQKIVVLFASIGFVGLLIVPALDHRFGWSAAPLYVILAGDILVAAGFYITFLVYKENSFTSAIIEVVEDQKVVSTGPYALVRHPMYTGAFPYCLGTPLALGS